MIFKDTRFILDGVKNDRMGLYLISVESELVGSFGTQKTIKEEKISNIDTPFNYGVDVQSIPTYKMTLAMLDRVSGNPTPFTKQAKEKIVTWLCKKRDYVPFISYDDLGITYYVQFEKIERKDFGFDNGYITADVKFNSPYGYANGVSSVTNYGVSKKFIVENKSNICTMISPILSFELLEDNTDITIKNLTLGQSMTFQGLPQEVKAKIYTDFKFIECDYNIYNNFNRQWISLVYGENEIEVIGKAKVKFEVSYPMSY